MSKATTGTDKRKKIITGTGIVLLLALLITAFLFFGKDKITDTPVLTIETPQKISLTETDEFTLDVTVSSLGDAIYPAASMSISFDCSRLEFLGTKEGNVFISNNESGVGQTLPQWSVNPDQCNKTGKINIMYLDTTGGKNAFSKELLSEDDNVLLRLKFRLRGSMRSGDVCDLIFEDAVFAASDEAQSLAMTTGSLKVKNGKIVVGE